MFLLSLHARRTNSPYFMHAGYQRCYPLHNEQQTTVSQAY